MYMEVPEADGLFRDGGGASRLLETLLERQEKEGYLSRETIRDVAVSLGVPLTEAWGVANFYKVFSLVPRGKHRMTVCMGTACHVRSAPLLLEEFSGQLNLEPGETSADGLVTVETVNCLGACGVGPVVVADEVFHHHMTPKKLRRLIRSVRRVEEEETEHD